MNLWESLLFGTWLLPALTFVSILLFSSAQERWIGILVRIGNSASSLVAAAAAFYFIFNRQAVGPFQYNLPIPFSDHEVCVAFNYDWLSLVFSLLTAFFGVVVIKFSSVYMHRENGYARFFAFIFLLMAGIQVLAIADSMTFFFMGWEFVGLASFFLISFYHHQPATVANALVVFAVYRIGDLGLLFCLLLFQSFDIPTSQALLSNLPHVIANAASHDHMVFFAMGLGIILCAAAKSAQFPFTFWLPRAMEGPTPSSAIFYGALAVHAGVLLLIRTQSAWSSFIELRIILGLIGFSTALVAEGCARVQSTIKGQLAFASAAQVGLIFSELSLGFTYLAIFHTVGHALLRAYQFLISPSIIAEKLHEQTIIGGARKFLPQNIERHFPASLRLSLYVFLLQEGYLLHTWRMLVIRPITNLFRSTTVTVLLVVLIALEAGCSIWANISLSAFISNLLLTFAIYLACTGVFGVTAATQRLNRIGGSFAGIFASVALLADHGHELYLLPLVFSLPFWLFSRVLLSYLQHISKREGLSFTGMFGRRRKLMWILVMLLCGVFGLPPFPSFLAEEMVMAQIVGHSWTQAVLVGSIIGLNGFGIFQLIAQVGMGQVSKV